MTQPDSKSGFVSRLRSQLNRGDSWLTYDLANLMPGSGLDSGAVEEFEDLLLQADVGTTASARIIRSLEQGVNSGRIKSTEQLRSALRQTLIELLQPCSRPLEIPEFIRPFVLMAVGVNGAGKTTTMGKLAARFRDQGQSVMLAAGDTYRAGAVAQLETWAERLNIPIIGQGQNSDAASVIFDAYAAAKARGADVLIADTAGRLHTQSGLMDELRKIKRVLQKQDAYAPHEMLLVIDATAGHNALTQAVQFHEAVGLTGVVLTKLDGTAKGGAIFAIAERLALPIRYIGVDESADDLGEFDAAQFIDALLGPQTAA